jgi:hypothetical protein
VVGVGHDGRGPDGLAEKGVVVVVDAHPPLGGDDPPLGLEDLGDEGQPLDAVGLHGDHGLEGGRREPVRVGGQIVARVGVVPPACELHAPVELAGADRGRPVEHHVLDEMGDARQAGPLVARADPEERVQGDAGDVVVLDEQDLEPVVERVDLDVLLLEGRRKGQGQGH